MAKSKEGSLAKKGEPTVRVEDVSLVLSEHDNGGEFLRQIDKFYDHFGFRKNEYHILRIPYERQWITAYAHVKKILEQFVLEDGYDAKLNKILVVLEKIERRAMKDILVHEFPNDPRLTLGVSKQRKQELGLRYVPIFYQLPKLLKPRTDFVGRVNEINSLFEWYSDFKESSIASAVVLVSGQEGFGKSTLVSYFCHIIRDMHLLSVLWLQCRTRTEFQLGLAGLLKVLGNDPPEIESDNFLIETFAIICKVHWQVPIILVLENAFFEKEQYALQEALLVLNALPPPKIYVIITSTQDQKSFPGVKIKNHLSLNKAPFEDGSLQSLNQNYSNRSTSILNDLVGIFWNQNAEIDLVHQTAEDMTQNMYNPISGLTEQGRICILFIMTCVIPMKKYRLKILTEIFKAMKIKKQGVKELVPSFWGILFGFDEEIVTEIITDIEEKSEYKDIEIRESIRKFLHTLKELGFCRDHPVVLKPKIYGLSKIFTETYIEVNSKMRTEIARTLITKTGLAWKTKAVEIFSRAFDNFSLEIKKCICEQKEIVIENCNDVPNDLKDILKVVKVMEGGPKQINHAYVMRLRNMSYLTSYALAVCIVAFIFGSIFPSLCSHSLMKGDACKVASKVMVALSFIGIVPAYLLYRISHNGRLHPPNQTGKWLIVNEKVVREKYIKYVAIGTFICLFILFVNMILSSYLTLIFAILLIPVFGYIRYVNGKPRIIKQKETKVTIARILLPVWELEKDI